VEDWEEFFVEKSRRRRDVVERRERAKTRSATIALGLIALFIVLGLFVMS